MKKVIKKEEKLEKGLEINYIELKDLKPSLNNPKKHSEEQVTKIAESIKKFGFKIPILIGKDNRIIAGHGRFLAAEKLKLKTIPSIFVDGLSEEEIFTFMIADNRVAESDWDTEKLYKLFEIIKEGDKKLLNLTGFSESEIDNLSINYDDLSKQIDDLELEHLQTIEWIAKFKNEDEFDCVREAILKIKQRNGMGCFKSDYSNGKALQILCEDCEENEDECNAEALKIISKKYNEKNGKRSKKNSISRG